MNPIGFTEVGYATEKKLRHLRILEHHQLMRIKEHFFMEFIFDALSFKTL